MRYLLTALLLLPALVLAQELHTFKNGEIADADKINQNFSSLAASLSKILGQSCPWQESMLGYAENGDIICTENTIKLYGTAGADYLVIDRMNRKDYAIYSYGGDDRIGLNGANTHFIDSGAGNDRLEAQYSEAGTYLITLGTGSDLIFFDDVDSHNNGYANTYTVTDFEVGEGGDILDLTDAMLNSNWAGQDPFDSQVGMLKWVNSQTGDALLYIDSDGFDGWQPERLLITLRGIASNTVVSDNLILADIGGTKTVYGTNEDDYIQINRFDRKDYTIYAYGGNDRIGMNGANTHTIDAGSGNDRLEAQFSEAGTYLITLGSGSDLIFFDDVDSHSDGYANTYTVTDFEVGTSGDILDLTDAIGYSNWSGNDPFDSTTGMLRWVDNSDGSASLYIDPDGFQGVKTERLLITLQGVSSPNLTSANYDW